MVVCRLLGERLPPTPTSPHFRGRHRHAAGRSTVHVGLLGALVALVELQFDGDDVKNSLCTVVPLPQVPSDCARMQITTLANALAWSREPVTRSWLAESRLSQFPTRESPDRCRAAGIATGTLPRRGRAKHREPDPSTRERLSYAPILDQSAWRILNTVMTAWWYVSSLLELPRHRTLEARLTQRAGEDPRQ